jgi:hypothetical protein
VRGSLASSSSTSRRTRAIALRSSLSAGSGVPGEVVALRRSAQEIDDALALDLWCRELNNEQHERRGQRKLRLYGAPQIPERKTLTHPQGMTGAEPD